MFFVYCRESIAKDCKLGRDINKVCLELREEIAERQEFIQELDTMKAKEVAIETATFLRGV
ncbi:hypothetical protein Tco_0023583, partial [Tanacetum coccineum]